METYLPILLIYSGSGSHDSQVTSLVEFVADYLKLSKDLISDHSDIHWLNSVDESPSIAVVRELQTQVAYQPYQLPHSVFIIQAVDTASTPAQNALLKLLEEPPAHVVLILTARHLPRVLATIQSRVKIQALVVGSAGTDEVADTQSQADFTQLYRQIVRAPFGELVELAEGYPDAATAKAAVTGLIEFLNHQLHLPDSEFPAAQLTAHLQVLLTGLDWLDKNVNPKLALTETMFQLKRKLPVLPPSKATAR